jgi:hypothetical protein
MAAVAPLPAGSRVAFADWPGPQAIALDLALQGAGLLSVPIPAPLTGAALAGALAERGAEVWLAPIEPGVSRKREGGTAGLPWHLIPAWISEEPSGLGGEKTVPSPPLVPGGGAVLAGGRPLSAAELIAAAAAVEAMIPVKSRREILVSCRPLADPAARSLLAWATRTGAALLLEPDRAAGAATAVWARPTLFHGTAQDLAILRRAVERRPFWSRWRRRLPFDRLHTLFVEGDLAAGERSFWEGRGVHLATVPLP